MKLVAENNGFEFIEVRPASQGRLGGPIGMVQRCLGFINRAGCAVLRSRWPLITGHVFLMRKTKEIACLQTSLLASEPGFHQGQEIESPTRGPVAYSFGTTEQKTLPFH